MTLVTPKSGACLPHQMYIVAESLKKKILIIFKTTYDISRGFCLFLKFFNHRESFVRISRGLKNNFHKIFCPNVPHNHHHGIPGPLKIMTTIKKTKESTNVLAREKTPKKLEACGILFTIRGRFFPPFWLESCSMQSGKVMVYHSAVGDFHICPTWQKKNFKTTQSNIILGAKCFSIHFSNSTPFSFSMMKTWELHIYFLFHRAVLIWSSVVSVFALRI